LGGEVRYSCSHLLPDAGDGDKTAQVLCGLPTELIPGRSGGMFLRCTEGHMMPPPQAVRDAIRGHRDGTAAIQRGEVSADIMGGEITSEIEGSSFAPSNEAPKEEPPTGPVLPLSEAQDTLFADAAGIDAPALTRAEIDVQVQALLTVLMAATRDPARKAGAFTILRAHGYDEQPLTSWLREHPEELGNLHDALVSA
jgi:hypothetical protein